MKMRMTVFAVVAMISIGVTQQAIASMSFGFVANSISPNNKNILAIMELDDVNNDELFDASTEFVSFQFTHLGQAEFGFPDRIYTPDSPGFLGNPTDWLVDDGQLRSHGELGVRFYGDLGAKAGPPWGNDEIRLILGTDFFPVPDAEIETKIAYGIGGSHSRSGVWEAIAPVPEPSGLVLLGILPTSAFLRRKHKNKVLM